MLDPLAHRPYPRWFWFLVIAGAYLSLRGYHSFDGDQAYRLPILLHWQDPALYAGDPFVRAFDAFNPHRGYLAVLDWASRPFGLATALAGLFALTLAATMVGVDRLARAVWPDRSSWVGLMAVVLLLVAKAGNIGTNHLFEATLLDRLMAFGLSWLALAAVIKDPVRGIRWAAPSLGLATLIHPSVGLQISLTLASTWLVWGWRPVCSGVLFRQAIVSICLLCIALVPGLILIGGQSGRLMVGMPLDEFREWAVRVQGPQHMLPSTWRLPQWLAFGCYPVLGVLAYSGRSRTPPMSRLGSLLAVNLVSLTLAYVAVEVVGDLRVTLFQPFRMATLARGLCLIILSGRLVELWERGDLASRGRVVLIAVGLIGDWSLVVATLVEATLTLAGARIGVRSTQVVGSLVLILGLVFLNRHDTDSGQNRILAALGTLVVGTGLARLAPMSWNRRRQILTLSLAWAIPIAAWVASLYYGDRVADHPVARVLVGRCRFVEVPIAAAERVAVWCRDQTPIGSRFIVPPGEKEFRLWSRRSVAFNRAGSPYHAAGLLDWSERFRAHVGFTGTSAEFARAYLAGRHGLEADYDRMTDQARLALARNQGATHILQRFAKSNQSGKTKPSRERHRLIAIDGYVVDQIR